ncbi:hypothetical protein BDZ89DRAFT_1138069 [Hymenopellis radicata]|nr:hypothetical protein BDZ89DRAFT_1138069 [Hymenopellis radicata]
MSVHFDGGRFSPYPLDNPPVPAFPKFELVPVDVPMAASEPGDDDLPTEIPNPFENPHHHTFHPPHPIADPIGFGVPLPGYKCGGRVYTAHLHTARVFQHYQENEACVTKSERDAYRFVYSNKLDDDGFQVVTDTCTPGFKPSFHVPKPRHHYNHALQTALVSTYRFVCQQPGTFTRQLCIRGNPDVHVRDDNLTWLELRAIGRFLHYYPERFMLDEALFYPWNSTYIPDIRAQIVDVVDFDNNHIQPPAGIDYYSLDYSTFPLYHRDTGRLICQDPNGFEAAAQKLMDRKKDTYLPVSYGITGFAELVSEEANMFFIDAERRSERMMIDVLNHHHGRYARCSHCGHDDGLHGH